MNLLDRVPPTADHRIPYGPDPSQFGDLWLPHAATPAHGWPVVAFLHGGWWSSAYDLLYGGFLCHALRQQGILVWSIEYRRTGATGGGWPATFQDVAAGFDHLADLGPSLHLDLTRVIAVGHSAGGHLAFWLGGRPHIPESSLLHPPQPRVPLHGLVGLAAAVDLQLLFELATGAFSTDKLWVEHLMGGSPVSQPDRYAAGDPGHLLPLVCPQILVQGTADEQIPPGLPAAWARKATRAGNRCQLHLVPGASHFDVVDPQSHAWHIVQATITSLL